MQKNVIKIVHTQFGEIRGNGEKGKREDIGSYGDLEVDNNETHTHTPTHNHQMVISDRYRYQ